MRELLKQKAKQSNNVTAQSAPYRAEEGANCTRRVSKKKTGAKLKLFFYPTSTQNTERFSIQTAFLTSKNGFQRYTS